MSYKRFGTAHRGGVVKMIASDLGEFGIAYQWTIWTAIGAEGNGGECVSETDAMECLIHALDPEEGAGERLLQS